MKTGICGNTIRPGLGGPPLVCDLLAGHAGWHGCDQFFESAPQGRPWLTSTVSRCHWTEPENPKDPAPPSGAEAPAEPSG